MRQEKRISGVRFAELAGWSRSSLVSMIERGQRSITADHVRLWCRICGASDRRTEELLGEQANAARMWVTYQQLNRGGLTAAQKSVRQEYEELTLSRAYQPKVIHGMLQTQAYTLAALRTVQDEQRVDVADSEDDLAEAVAERMDRQTLLGRPDARWLFLLEETVLWLRPYSRELHAAQLRHLLATMKRPTVSLGIIPANADRRAIHPVEAFDITDAELVTVELVSGYLSVTQPAEIAMYVAAWDRLWSLAAFGKPAVALIERALADLEGQDGL
ncbi:helix-turn-helix transcriptional regulator [Actinomadura fulvescens]|uniref:Helix-turn-helix transcriptional regulator n=2 Tax=Actinomadura fulvescens TaxID=46160 RepID=A0ABN3QHM3_9ACTN